MDGVGRVHCKTTLKLLAYHHLNPAIYVPGNDAQGRPLSTEGNAESRVPFAPGIYGPPRYWTIRSQILPFRPV